jgi:hypothetical protein
LAAQKMRGHESWNNVTGKGIKRKGPFKANGPEQTFNRLPLLYQARINCLVIGRFLNHIAGHPGTVIHRNDAITFAAGIAGGIFHSTTSLSMRLQGRLSLFALKGKQPSPDVKCGMSPNLF